MGSFRNLHDAEGVPVSFELLLVESPYYDKIGVTFVENMKELGIEEAQMADFATLLSRTDGTFNYMTIRAGVLPVRLMILPGRRFI